MGAVAFNPQSLLSFNKQLKLGKPIFSPREIADWYLPFAIQTNSHKFTILCIKSDGSRRSRPPWKGYAVGRSNEERNELPQSSDGKVSSSSDKEEIIALLERIKSSISKRENVRRKKRNPSTTSQDKPTFESNMNALHQPGKEVKGTSSIENREVKKWRRRVPKKEQKTQNDRPVRDFKLTRLTSSFVKRSPITSLSVPRGNIAKLKREPSSFVRRSPIPNPSAPRRNIPKLNLEPSRLIKRSPISSPSAASGNILELNHEPSANKERNEQLELQGVEKLKLPQLKELAKARGIKGYSRMKKSELLKLLRS